MEWIHVAFLVELSRAVSMEWVLRCLNVYTDDCQMGDLFHSREELQLLMHNIAIIIELLTSFGLTINPAKCTVLLTMGGTNFRKLRASLTTWRDGKEWFCFTGTESEILGSIGLQRQISWHNHHIQEHGGQDSISQGSACTHCLQPFETLAHRPPGVEHQTKVAHVSIPSYNMESLL